MPRMLKQRFIELGGIRLRFIREYQRGDSLGHREFVVVNPETGVMCITAELDE